MPQENQMIDFMVMAKKPDGSREGARLASARFLRLGIT
jgi:hypothetical protein